MSLVKLDPKIFDNDLDYFPLYNGLQESSMGLNKLYDEDKTFLINEDNFHIFRRSKELCREYNIEKFYKTLDENNSEVLLYIVETLAKEYPQYFTWEFDEDWGGTLSCELTNEVITVNKDLELINYESDLSISFVDTYDAVAMQIPEDIVIQKVDSDFTKDWASVTHLCHCNGWTAEWAIGQSFDYIHRDVPRINEIIPDAMKMMKGIVNSQNRFERVAAIALKESPILNRHFDFENEWNIHFDLNDPLLHIRVERQTIRGFRKFGGYLFTIRTFTYDVDVNNSSVNEDIKNKRKEKIREMFEYPNERAYSFEKLKRYKEDVLKWIERIHED